MNVSLIRAMSCPSPLRHRLPLVALTLALAACGDDVAGISGDDAAAPDDSYCQLLHRVCERQIECGAAVIDGTATVADCYAATHCEELLPEIAAAGAVFRPGDIATCAAAIEDASCIALTNARYPAINPACQTPFEGTGDDGDACDGGVLSDCRAGLRCDTAASCPGVCRPEGALACTPGSCAANELCTDFAGCQPLPAISEACVPSTIADPWLRSCAAGAWCHDEVCEASAAAGQACASETPYACDGDFACVAGTCVAASQIGESCDSLEGCAPELWCDFATDTCAAAGARGEACDTTYGACRTGLSCHYPASAGCHSHSDCALTELCCDDAAGARCVAFDSDPRCALPIGSCEPGPAPESPRPLAPTGAVDADCGGVDLLCPLGTTCTCTVEGCAEAHCRPGPGLGDACVGGDIVDLGDPAVCARGICDVLSTNTCVQPGGAGAPCHGAAKTVTLECLSLICEDSACLPYDAPACDP